jgi:hypothetical protein
LLDTNDTTISNNIQQPNNGGNDERLPQYGIIAMTNSRIQYDLGVLLFGVLTFNSLSSIRGCFIRNFSLVKFYTGKQNNEDYL